MNLVAFEKGFLEKVAQKVYHWADPSSLELIKRKGLLPTQDILNDEEVLEAIAKSRGVTAEDLRENMLATQKKRPFVQGVNVMTALPTETQKQRFSSKHPFNEIQMKALEIDLGRYISDLGPPRMHGLELVPYGQHKHWSDRHKDITIKELQELSSKGTSIWDSYSDPEDEGYYAPDVPHISILDKIPPQYIREL